MHRVTCSGPGLLGKGYSQGPRRSLGPVPEELSATFSARFLGELPDGSKRHCPRPLLTGRGDSPQISDLSYASVSPSPPPRTGALRGGSGWGGGELEPS